MKPGFLLMANSLWLKGFLPRVNKSRDANFILSYSAKTGMAAWVGGQRNTEVHPRTADQPPQAQLGVQNWWGRDQVLGMETGCG